MTNRRGVSLGIALACCLTWPVMAEEESTRDQAVTVANAYADCSAFYLHMSEFMVEQGRPAGAEGMRNFANGAKTAALYYLAMEWTLRRPNEPRTYGSFMAMVQGRIDTSVVRFRALQEMEDFEALKAEGETCTELLPGQEEAIQAIRNQSADNE